MHRFSHQLRTYIPDSARLAGEDLPAPAAKSRAKWLTRDELAKAPLGKAQKLIWAAHLSGEKRTAASSAKRKRVVVAASKSIVASDDDEDEAVMTAPEVEDEEPVASSGETSDDEGADEPIIPRVPTPRRQARTVTSYVERPPSDDEDEAEGDEDAAEDDSGSEYGLDTD